MSGKNGHKSAEMKPWERQEGESDKAFAAFRVYLEMGPKRSIAAVAQECTKSVSLIKRWSKRWDWRVRVRKHTDSLTAKTDRQVQHQAEIKGIELMGSTEVIGRTSMLARASAADLLNEQGEFDIADVRRRGLGYLISGVKTRTTTQPNGARTVTQEFKVENRKGFLELMGKHHLLWSDESMDWDEILARLTGIPKALLPAKLDEPSWIEAEPIEVSNKNEARSLALPRNSTALAAQLALDASSADLEKQPEAELSQQHKSLAEKTGRLDEELKNVNQQPTDGQRLQRQDSANLLCEPTPRESVVSNPLTPSKVELDEKAPRENKLRGYRRLNREKSAVEYGLKAFRKLDSEKP